MIENYWIEQLETLKRLLTEAEEYHDRTALGQSVEIVDKLINDIKIEKAMKNTSASLQIEELNVPEKHYDLVRERLQGKISKKDFLQRLLDGVNENGS
jgi:hypothetical protein